jgi:hypothetical protein
MANDVAKQRIQGLPRRWAIRGLVVGSLWAMAAFVYFVWTGVPTLGSFFFVIAILVCGIAVWVVIPTLYGLLARWHLKKSQHLPDDEAYDAIHKLPSLYALVGAVSLLLLSFASLLFDSQERFTLERLTVENILDPVPAVVFILIGVLIGSMIGFATRDNLRKLLKDKTVPRGLTADERS